MKQDKSTTLNLDIVTAKLLSVYNCIKREYNIKETEKKQKAKQVGPICEVFLCRTGGGSFKNKKKSKKSKSKLRSIDENYHICGKKGH